MVQSVSFFNCFVKIEVTYKSRDWDGPSPTNFNGEADFLDV